MMLILVQSNMCMIYTQYVAPTAKGGSNTGAIVGGVVGGLLGGLAVAGGVGGGVAFFIIFTKKRKPSDSSKGLHVHNYYDEMTYVILF